MKIFRVKGGTQPYVHSFVFAPDKKAAKKAVPKGMDVVEWNVCMGSRHGKIPGTDKHPSPLAKQLIGGVPLCDICYAQQTISVNDRLDRLEELVVDLCGDLNRHTDDGHGYGSD
jgi:hypothetical protein